MKIKHKNKGFTLIELMIVVVIITILTVGVVSSLRLQTTYLQYDQSVININALIKEARNYVATSRPVFDTSMPPGQESYIPEQGYGVYIERSPNLGESVVILFANTSDSDNITIDQFDNGDLIEERLTIPTGTTFDGLEMIDLGPPESRVAVDRAVILFRTPLAETFIGENDDPAAMISPAEPYDTLEMTFFRTSAGAASGQRTISINNTAGFSEIELP